MRIRVLLGHLAVAGLGIAFLAADQPAWAQPASEEAITTSTRPARAEDKPAAPENPLGLFQMHYENRVKSFREQNRVYQNVVLLGDSITEGFDVDKYLPGRRVINRGIGADVIGNDLAASDKRGVLKRLNESVFDCAPVAVFILIGINDLGQGHTPDMVERGYRAMLQEIRARRPKLKVYVQSLLPTRGGFAKHNANIIDLNRRLQKLAGEFDCEYLDLHSLMADDAGELKAEFTNDGLHLKPAAYEVWRDQVEEKLGWR